MANLEQVFKNWQGRRAALLKALTTESDDLYEQCDPEKLNLCLYGKPNEEWELSLPSENIPPEVPDPTLGINFARDGIIKKKDWLKMVAVHSDAWLLSVAFYEGAKLGFDKAQRAQLFDMVNEFPYLIEEVVADQDSSSDEEEEEEGEEEEVNEDEDKDCGKCRKSDKLNELWVCCDMCDTWFHGQCVNVTPAIADRIKKYICTSCSDDQSWHQCTVSCWKLFGKCVVV